MFTSLFMPSLVLLLIFNNSEISAARPSALNQQSAVDLLLTQHPICHGDSNWQFLQENSPLFDTKKLADAPLIRSFLQTKGFKPVTFTTCDAIHIKGLFRKNEGAPYTLVSFCGFFPGRKEGMATLLHLIDPQANLLLVDARGHGESAGPFAQSLLWDGDYGLDEHNDVTAALEYAAKITNGAPIIVHGLCMGGRHATRALAFLSSTPATTEQLSAEKCGPSLLTALNVRGFICDSTPINASSLKSTLKDEIILKMLPQLIKKVPSYNMPKKQIVQSKLFKLSSAVVRRGIFPPLARFIDARGLDYNERTNAIVTTPEMVKAIQCSILFVHPERDTYVACAGTKTLAPHAQDGQTWYAEQKVPHGGLHIAHPDLYCQKMHNFIQSCLQKPVSLQVSPPLPVYDDSRKAAQRRSEELLNEAYAFAG